MRYSDKFPYVPEPPGGWLRAIGNALKQDFPIPPLSLTAMRRAVWASVRWLMGFAVLFVLGLLALWLATIGVQMLESGSKWLWPAYIAFPFLIVATGVAMRAGLIFGKAPPSHGAPKPQDAYETEQQLAMRRYDRRRQQTNIET